ncbi:MAG: nuclear transport factor 2 family protein [Flavisolibacter sp.]
MKKVLLLLLVTSSSNFLFAQKENKEIESSIIGFFNGLSLINPDTLKFYSSTDFQLLENGEIWNLDTLIVKIMPRKNSNIQRINNFNFVKTEQNNETAWVSYYNTADYRLGDKQQTVKWLESAVLKKSNGKWKIQMLHSTKLK